MVVESGYRICRPTCLNNLALFGYCIWLIHQLSMWPKSIMTYSCYLYLYISSKVKKKNRLFIRPRAPYAHASVKFAFLLKEFLRAMNERWLIEGGKPHRNK